MCYGLPPGPPPGNPVEVRVAAAVHYPAMVPHRPDVGGMGKSIDVRQTRRRRTGHSPLKWLRMPVVSSPLLLMCTLAAGCGPLPRWKNPLATPLPEYKTQYGLTPAQKVARLQQLATDMQGEHSPEIDKTAQAIVAELEREPDPLLRKAMVSTLGQLATDASLPGLRAAVDDPAPAVRVAACKAWARRGDGYAEAALAGLLVQDHEVDVRLAAAEGLARCNSTSSVQHLAAALEDRDPALQLAAMDALEKTTGRDLGKDTAAWKDFVAHMNPASSQDAKAAARLAGRRPPAVDTRQ